MLSKISAAIKGLSLNRPFSTIGSRTLKSSMDNHDTQPLRYLAKESKPPLVSESLKMDVKKHKRMGNLEDERILE